MGGLPTRAAGHQRYAGRLGRGLMRRRGDRCEQHSSAERQQSPHLHVGRHFAMARIVASMSFRPAVSELATYAPSRGLYHHPHAHPPLKAQKRFA